jgi:hypothetical protein
VDEQMGVVKKKAPRAPLDCPKEDYEQILSANFLRSLDVPWYHIPNGGRRDEIEGAKFKRMGVSAGAPDVCVCVARKGYHGLYIELKRKYGGRLSESQKKWRDDLIREGYAWFMAQGHEECIKIILEYLDISVIKDV